MTRAKWAKLSPDKQRIKVAELCGWEPRIEDVPGGCIGFLHHQLSEMPDYPNDLNAMHDAIANAPCERDDFEQVFIENLFDVVQADHDEPVGTFELIFATAAQRAEAFVLTMDRREHD